MSVYLPNWIVTSPNCGYCGSIKIFSQYGPDEDKRYDEPEYDDIFSNFPLVPCENTNPRMTRKIQRSLSVQCLPSSAMYWTPWRLDLAMYSITGGEHFL